MFSECSYVILQVDCRTVLIELSSYASSTLQNRYSLVLPCRLSILSIDFSTNNGIQWRKLQKIKKNWIPKMFLKVWESIAARSSIGTQSVYKMNEFKILRPRKQNTYVPNTLLAAVNLLNCLVTIKLDKYLLYYSFTDCVSDNTLFFL